ncbi:MAG: ABC transporter permease [Phycisphaerales bacterium]
MREFGVSALRLARAPLGPLFDLEVRSAGRRRTTYLVRAGYALLLLFVVGVALAGLLEEASHQGPAARLQALSGVAPTLTVVIGWLQFIVLTQMAPVLTAAAICNEKQQRTLPALATTPLSAGQIVLGKLAGRLMQMLILVLASLPALLAVRWLGGLATEPVIAVTALTISSMLFSGALGMLVALRCKRARTAAAVTMATVALLYLSPLLLLALGVNILGFQPSGWWFIHSAKVDPAIAMGMVTAGVMNPAIGTSLTSVWLYPSLAAVGGAGLCCAVASAGLRRTIREEVGGAPKRGRAAKRAAKALAKTRDSRLVGERVLLWREQRFGRLLASRTARTSAAVVGLALLALYIFGGTDVTGFHIAMGIMGGAASLFVASQATVGCIAGERESRTWDALVATPLSGRTIVYQKFVGALWRVAIGPAFLTLHFTVFGALGVTHPLGALHVGAIALGFSVFLAGTGVLFSLLMKKSAVAGACNIGLAIGLWVGLPLLIAFTLGAVLRVSEDVIEPVATIGALGHPGFLLINGVLIAAENGNALDSGMMIADGAYGEIAALDSLGALEFTAFYLASSIGAALVGVGAVEAAVRMFPKRGGRA